MYESLEEAAANIAESRRLCIEAAALRTRYAAVLFAIHDARSRTRELLASNREIQNRTGRPHHPSSA